jgi:hypothetical protein
MKGGPQRGVRFFFMAAKWALLQGFLGEHGAFAWCFDGEIVVECW